MSFITLISALGLIAVASATVTIKPAPNVTVYSRDLLQFNISELFDYGAGVTCDSLSGEIVKYTTPQDEITSKDISDYHFGDEPEIVQFLSNTTIFGVFDNSNVLIQQINLDHESFGTTVVKSFGRPGAEAICTDVAFNKNTNIIFIACFAKASVSTPNSTLWIYEINGATGDTVNKYSTTINDEDQKIVHRANIMLVPIQRGSKVELGVIVYDQGISSGAVDKNSWAWVLSGADTGALADHNIVDLHDIPLSSIYDMFPLRDGILVTGKNSSLPKAPIQLASCNITLSGDVTITCDPRLIVAPFNTNLGYVGIFNTGQYVEVNADLDHKESDLISICNFNGNFGDANFIDTNACASIPSFTIPDDVAISLVEGNVHQIVIQYAHFDSTYAGYSLHNFDLRYETNHIDDSLAHHNIPIGKSIIKVNKTGLAIQRMVPPYFFIKAEKLDAKQQIIRVECKDVDSTTPVANFINITMIESMLDGVYLNHDKIPDFSVYDGGRFMFQINSDMMMGNDLSVQVSFDPNLVNYTNAQVYDTEHINIDWRVTNTSINFQDIHFSGKFAVTLDTKGWVSFHQCSFTEIAALECVEKASYNLNGHNLVLKKDVNAVYDWLFAWAIDKDVNNTFIFIFDGQNLFLHPRAGAADDCAMAEVGEFAYQVCAYQNAGEVRGYQYSQLNPQVGIPMPVINLKISARDYFCPIDIDFDPRLNYVLEILSVCDGKDQRILRYRYPPAINRKTGEQELLLITSIPINFAFQNPQYCSMGTEFVVYSNRNGKIGDLQSFNVLDDLNSWNFGTLMDDLNLGEITDFNCIPRAGVFSTVSKHPDDPSKVNLAVYLGNNQWQANRKVYNTRREGLDQYKFIDSYEFMGQVIHTLSDPLTHTYNFMLSFTQGPIVDVHLEHGAISQVSANGTIGINIDIRNTKQKVPTIVKSVEIVNASTSVKITTTKKLTSVQSGILELEDFIKIKGPVADVILRNVSTENRLLGRLHEVGLYTPPEKDQGVFSHLETFRSTSVGVRTTPANISIFTVFQNITGFVGLYTPAHGVNAFHFAPLASDPDRSILIAYSTAEPTSNSLQIVVLKDADRVAIGQAGSADIFNFSMIRVVPLASANGQDRFLIMGMNGDEHTIHHFIASYSNGRVTVETKQVIDNVHDFGYASPANSSNIVVVYNVKDGFNQVSFELIDKTTGLPSQTHRQTLDLDFYGLKGSVVAPPVISIFAKEHNDTAFYVIINYASPYITESIYDSANNYKDPQKFTYMKMPGHDGRYMDGNMQNFVMMTSGDIQSGDAGARYIFYTRQSQLNNGSAFPIWTFHNDIPRPFTMTNCRKNNSHFQYASPFSTVPAVFLTVAPMQINVTNPQDLQYAILEIDAAAHVESAEISIASIINNEGEPKKAMAWWPFLLVIGVLILLAVGFIAYKAQKDKALEKESSENYISLKPEAKDGKTERESQ